MAFPESFLEEIKTRVPLAAVVGRKVKLTKKGKEHTGLCPFHHEKSPSFTVNEDKGFYHCFGCQAHGSIFDFVMKTEGLQFPEAVERLAAQAGLQMPERSPQEAQQRDQRETLIAACEAAALWFTDQLRQRAGEPGRKYFESRKLGGDAIAQFRLGYAPDSRTALKQTLIARGMSEQVLVEAGLLIRPEEGESRETYDRFRNRVMFPITDGRGRVVAFGGRTLGDAKPKYLNSPETALFHKGALLYNLRNAREAARDAGTVLLCEGYTDVIALAQAGMAHAVAPLGTAVTELQLRELWRMTPEPIVCLDGDAAGLAAAVRAAHRALALLQPGQSLRFAVLPAGEDPDSLLRAGRMADVKAALDSATPLADILWRATAAGDYSTPERRAGLRESLKELVRQIAHPVVREYYKRYFSEALQKAFPAPTQPERRPWVPQGEYGRGGFKGRRPLPMPKLTPRAGAAVGGSGPRERVLLAALVNHPALLTVVDEQLAQVTFQDADLDTLRHQLLDIAPSAESLDSASLRAQLTGAAKQVADRLVAESTSMVDKFVRPETDLAAVETGWRDVLVQHMRAGELEHRWF